VIQLTIFLVFVNLYGPSRIGHYYVSKK